MASLTLNTIWYYSFMFRVHIMFMLMLMLMFMLLFPILFGEKLQRKHIISSQKFQNIIIIIPIFYYYTISPFITAYTKYYYYLLLTFVYFSFYEDGHESEKFKKDYEQQYVTERPNGPCTDLLIIYPIIYFILLFASSFLFYTFVSYKLYLVLCFLFFAQFQFIGSRDLQEFIMNMKIRFNAK